jgi:hypothetical protein
MVSGAPDGTAFRAVVTAALEHVRTGGFKTVRLYGEMVNLLWQDQLEAALLLEGLWNEILVDRRLSLLCAYRLDPLDADVQEVFRRIAQCHSELLPPANYGHFEDAVDRAYADVFGPGSDTATLRRLMGERMPPIPVVPEAQAAIFALHDLPKLVGEEVRERAHRYYRRRRQRP